MEKQEELGVLWKKISKNGHAYLSGKIHIDVKTDLFIVILPITSENPKAPQYKILEAKPYDATN